MSDTLEKRTKALEIAKSQIAKQFGNDAIMTLDGENKLTFQESISTGCLSLDIALGVGGVPRGRVTEIYGPESSGKTTLALHIIAEAQKAGGYAAFIDAEHALDIYWAEKLGVNLKELQVNQPDSGEQALEVTEMLVRSNALDVIVIDSAAALVPRAELEGEMGDSHMGLQARLMSQALRKLTEPVKKSKTALIFINQIREKIGVVYGNPETTPGGRALKFYTSVRMEIRRVTTIKDGPDSIGNRTKVKVVKNKVSAPFKVIEFDIMYNEGISFTGDILDLAIKAEIIDKMGSWFSYGDKKIGQGRENAKQFLIDNKKERKEIVKKVKAFIGVDEVKPKKKSES